MPDILITDASSEPVTAAELREELRQAPDGDAELELLIGQARRLFEEKTGLATMQQTRRLTLDSWPQKANGGLGWWDGEKQGSILSGAARAVELPIGPLISISSVTTYAADNTTSAFSSSNYFADTGRLPGRLALGEGAVWPWPGRSVAGIEIEYLAGYADAADVPGHWKRAIMQIAAHWYENRELMSPENGHQVPMMAQRVINSARIRRL